jgi:hypothetical protein
VTHRSEEDITLDMDLSFEKNCNRWKDINEKKTMVPLRGSFELVKGNKF